MLRFFKLRAILVVAYAITAAAGTGAIGGLLPPFGNPDEPAHFLKAESMTEFHVIPSMTEWNRLGGRVDDSAIELVETIGREGRRGPLPPEIVERIANLGWAYHRTPAAFANTAQYGPLLYAPQAYILGLSKYTGGPILIGYEAARAVAALLAIGISALALGLARRGTVALLIIFLTPAVTSLSFTIGHEGLIFALSGLYAALLSRLEIESHSRSLNLAAIVCLILLAMARPPYALLSLLLLTPGRRFIRTGGVNWPWIGIAAAFIMPALWLLVSGSIGSIPNLKAGIEPGAQIGYVLGHLTALPNLIGATLDRDGEIVAQHLVGVLGWLSVMLPQWCYHYGWLALALAAFACALDEPGPRLAAAAWRLSILVLTGLGLALALYVTWTPVGASLIEGLQGRYFIPLLLVMSQAIPSIPLSPALRRPLAIGVGALALALMLPVLGQAILFTRHIYGAGG